MRLLAILLLTVSLFAGDSTYKFDALGLRYETHFNIHSAKLTGSYVTASAQIDGGDASWSLLFDASTTESVINTFRLPNTYTSTPVLQIQYTMASATSGKVDLECEVMAVADGEAPDTASFDSVNEISGGTTVPGTALTLDTISIPLTNNDSMAVGELVILRINRDHDDADDDATGDLKIKSITLTWS
jgi:hypothetical protein